MDIQEILNKAQEHKKLGELSEALDLYNQAYDFLIKEATQSAKKTSGTTVDEGSTRKIMPKYFVEAEKYLKNDNVVCIILNNMGVIFAELGDKKNAKKYFEESIKLTPNKLNYQNPHVGLKSLE